MADRSAGVEIRFTTKDLETVKEALRSLGTEGQKMADRLTQAGKATQPALKGINDVVAGITTRAGGLNNSLGIVGVAMRALGPVGIAVGAALAGTLLVMKEMSDEANRMGDTAIKLRTLSEATGLTSEQIQVITKSGDDLGISQEKVSSSVERFTGNLDALRRGTGPLFDALIRVDSGLTRQLMTTKDSATAWDLLARAYTNAQGAQRSAIAGAAFGKQNISSGGLLNTTGQAGGLDEQIRQQQQSILLTKEQTDRWAELKTKIDSTKQNAKDILASIFTDEVLQKELQWAEMMERGAKAARDIANSQVGLSFWQKIVAGLAQTSDTGGYSQDDVAMSAARSRAAKNITDGVTKAPDLSGWKSLDAAISGVNEKLDENKTKSDAALTAQGAYALLQRQAAVLGSAITPAEQLALQIGSLNAKFAEGGASRDDYNRSLAELKRASDAAIVSVRQRIGVASAEEISSTQIAALDKQQADGYIKNAQERAQAEQNVAKQVRETYEAMLVRNSALPGLTRLSLDAANSNKQIDQFGTSTLNNLDNALADTASGASKFSDAIKNMATSVIRDFELMVSRSAITGPLASLFTSAFGVGSSSTLGAAAAVGGHGLYAKGEAFNNGNVVPFARGGIVTRPVLFPMANGAGLMGEAGPEAVMPLTRVSGGNLGVRAVGGGSAMTIINVNVAAGAGAMEKKTSDQLASGIAQLAVGQKKITKNMQNMPAFVKNQTALKPAMR